MITHTQLLNHLATTFNLESYLEIGVQDTKKNFDKIKCNNKIGVDPDIKAKATHCMTSDRFFMLHDLPKFDLVFVDGLHHSEQARLDFFNSLYRLNENGFILLHDTLPTREEYTHVPRDSKIWFGDVYKFACSLSKFGGIDFCTLNMDCGCTIVWQDDTKKNRKLEPVNTWEQFIHNKHLLNIVSEEEFYMKVGAMKVTI